MSSVQKSLTSQAALKSDLAQHVVFPPIPLSNVSHHDVGRSVSTVRLDLKDARTGFGC